MVALTIVFGMVTGLALGLTGAGGGLIGVPLLVYGLGFSASEAVGISLTAVCGAAALGAIERLWAGEVERRVALLFAASGMLTAPAGAILAQRLPEAALLMALGCLMLAVAARIWQRPRPESSAALDGPNLDGCGPSEEESLPAGCGRDGKGHLRLAPRCLVLLVALGLATGVLSGLFGVGGGFLLVPALVMALGLDFRRAVGTTMLAVALTSSVGVAAHMSLGGEVALAAAGWFALGAVLGVEIGQRASRQIAPRHLERGFALALVAVGLTMILLVTLGAPRPA